MPVVSFSPDPFCCRRLVLLLLTILLPGCMALRLPAHAVANAQLTPPTRVTQDLLRLPEPKGKVVVAVYGFRDQTGQYKSAPDSSFSTTVTQGAASLLVKAL
jgi:curli production assembly/transport component CsgG